MKDSIWLIGAFLAAFLMAFAATPIVKVLAGKIGAIDVPKDNRRMHKVPIPRLGGLAIFFGFMVSALAFCPISKEILGIFLGAAVIVVLGVFDDIYALSAKLKFPVQIVAAAVPVAFGVSVDFVKIPFLQDQYLNLGWLGPVVTVIWIVAVTNAVNLIDGLDGLAVGVSSIASLAVFVVALIAGDPAVAILTAALTGACFGFLPYNFNPASIFMGDTGATFLGFILASVSVQGLFKSYAFISIAVPLLILGLPIFDTGFAILRRVKNKQPIMGADRGHLHHRLIDMGLSQRQAVLVIYGICFLLAACAVMLTNAGALKAIVMVVVILAVLLFTGINYASRKRQKAGQAAKQGGQETTAEKPEGEENKHD